MDALKTNVDYIICGWLVLIKSTFNVEYNVLPSINKQVIYVNNTDKKVYGNIFVGDNQQTSISVCIPSPYSYTSLMISAIDNLDSSALLYRYIENEGSTSVVIATQKYVDNKIIGAINTNY